MIELDCFSKFAMRIDGNAVNLHSAKAEELIAFLACENGLVSKHKVAETLWATVLPEQAMDSLYKVLQHIKHLPFYVPVVQARGKLSLDLSSVKMDLAEFLSYYESFNIKDWEKAVSLYRDILLVDNCYDWSNKYEARYDTYYYEILSRLVEYYQDKNNPYMAYYYQSKLTTE